MKFNIKELFEKNKIKNIKIDSRLVEEGDAFFAIKGVLSDGNKFIEDAFNNGAKIVFSDQGDSKDNRVYQVMDVRLALNEALEIMHPNIPDKIIAVTGTNGKSSIVSYVRQVLDVLGVKAASLGTLGLESSHFNVNKDDAGSGLTTSDAVNFRKLLASIKEHSIDSVAFEASSHGLHQSRIGNIKADSCAFVSFSQDHLDYHKTMKDYLDAKLLLFKNHLKKDGEAVIFSEIDCFEEIVSFFQKYNIKYSAVGKNGDIKIMRCTNSIFGSDIEFSFNNKIYKFKTDIIGSFQAVNLLIAAKLVHNLGVKFSDIVNSLENIEAVCGRMQRITTVDSKYHVFVDYAHTPDALEKSLTELQKLRIEGGKVYVIFGCGGDRDKEKRPVMGSVASKYTDLVVVTDDNPRTENSAVIREEIIQNINNYVEYDDREKAIIEMIGKLRHNDILLIAGKGHEDYQIVGNNKVKFSDINIAREALKINNKDY